MKLFNDRLLQTFCKDTEKLFGWKPDKPWDHWSLTNYEKGYKNLSIFYRRKLRRPNDWDFFSQNLPGIEKIIPAFLIHFLNVLSPEQYPRFFCSGRKKSMCRFEFGNKPRALWQRIFCWHTLKTHRQNSNRCTKQSPEMKVCFVLKNRFCKFLSRDWVQRDQK